MGAMAKQAKRQSLNQALMKRPTLEELQGTPSTAGILPPEEEASIDKQINEKRKRLSGLLVNRPPADKLQAILSPREGGGQ